MKTHRRERLILWAAFVLSLAVVPQATLLAANEPATAQPADDGASISGVVIDEFNEPLIGATVKVKGTTEGMLTDMNGRFTFTTAVASPVLVITYMGYDAQEIAVGNRRNIQVKMVPAAAHDIKEVVVTAMGILRKEKSLTYATQQVKSDELMRVQEANVANSLEGKVAGVTVTASAGGAGGASKIQLRGAKSIIGDSSPLIVIDGIPITNDIRNQTNNSQNMTEYVSAEGSDALSMVNPDDIESINVLKGANAAALYGSRAANGVLMITTKKGKSGKLSVSYTGNVTFDVPLTSPKIQNRYGAAVDAQGYLGSANGWGGLISESPTTALARQTDKMPYERELHLRNHGNDDVADFYRTGVTTNNSVSLSGGTEKVQSYFSVANTHALGLIETNSYNRNTLAFRQTYRLWDRLTINASLNYAQTRTRNRIGGGTVGNPIYHLYTAPRNIDMGYYRDNYVIDDATWLSDEQGHYVQTETGFIRQNDRAELTGPMMNYAFMDARQNNPYWLLKQNRGLNKEDRVYGGFQGSLDIWGGLSAQARFNFDHDKYQEQSVRYATTFSPATMYDYGTYNKRRDNKTEIYVDYMLNYDKTFNDTWSVSANLGWTGHTTKNSFYGTYIANATVVDPLNQKLNTVVNRFNTTSGSSGVTTESQSNNWDRAWLATAQFGWKERIYLDASWRRDEYRVFRQFPDKPQAYNYFGFGANALLSDLVKLPEWWTYAKYRISYSQVGNAIPARLYYAVGGNNRTGALGASSSLLRNVKPEETHSFETGLELLFIDNRLSFDITYYNSTIRDLYMGIGNAAGITVWDNVASLRNQGVETTLAYNFRFGKNVRWRTAANFSYNKNKILSVGTDDNGNKNRVYTDVAGVRVRYTEGDTFGDMYVRDLRHNDDGTIFLSSSGNLAKEGLHTKYIGNMNSPYQLGWSNTVNWKNLQFSFLINGRIGGKVISITEAFLDEMGLSQRTADARDDAYANDLFTEGGEPAMYLPDGSGHIIGVKNYYQVMGARGSQYSPLYVYNATNFRLRELSLAYTFKDVFGENKDISLSFIARNLFFIYKDAPVDPDVSLSTGNGLGGFELFNTPSTRSFGFNVKLTL